MNVQPTLLDRLERIFLVSEPRGGSSRAPKWSLIVLGTFIALFGFLSITLWSSSNALGVFWDWAMLVLGVAYVLQGAGYLLRTNYSMLSRLMVLAGFILFLPAAILMGFALQKILGPVGAVAWIVFVIIFYVVGWMRTRRASGIEAYRPITYGKGARKMTETAE